MRCIVGVLALLAITASACSGSVDISFGTQTPAEAAVDLIEGEAMRQRLGVPPITDAVCDDVREAGTVFDCTAQSDGQNIDFEVLLEEDNRFFAAPTNVLDTFDVTRLESSAVEELNRENGLGLPQGAMDCGDSSVILDDMQQMTCVLTDPDTGTVFDALFTVTDTESGAFTVVIVGEASN